ncbi:Bacterial regulatory protein, luxR family [Planctomycetes bacterium Pan216]|uniref:Bacterial regulatory protein, luxR family n=1 Tax=Kolteria novifilia TaxID=2527975 RepID=A0A518AWY6_9BACT|nr:Bacterial regulatory protein, luxR family [Planctomycetes bacterium Pan216]
MSMSADSNPDNLSPQEREIIERTGRGETQDGIARQMGRSRKLVEHHLRNARAKLDARSTAHLQRVVHEKVQQEVADELEEVDRDADEAIEAIERMRARVGKARRRLRQPAAMVVGMFAISAIVLGSLLTPGGWRGLLAQIASATSERATSAPVDNQAPSAIETALATDPTIRFCASRNGKVFHAIDSSYAKRISANNLLVFKDAATAEQAGYAPSKRLLASRTSNANKP